MLHDMETGKVNCIVCKNLSRMFRNYSDQGYFLEKVFLMNKIRFITVSDPRVDTFLHPEMLNGLEVPINGLMNDRFAAKTSHDIRDTFATKRRKGEFIGAFAPYGYMKDPGDKNHLIIDEEAAGVVRKIYQWFVYGGMSKNGITRRLNELGVPNPAAYKRSRGLKYCNPRIDQNDGMWSPRTVSSILQNKMYIGTMVQGRQKVISYKVHDKVAVPEKEWYVVPDMHEPIVDEVVFGKAQELQRRDTRTAPGGCRLYLFSGLLKCADCKKVMTRQKSKGTVYYYCRTFRDKSKRVCSKHSIKEETVRQVVLATIQKQIALADGVPEIIEEINEAPVVGNEAVRLDTMLCLRQKELDKITKISDGLYGDWKSGDISKDEYHRLKAKYTAQTEQIRQNIKNIQNERKEMEKGIVREDPFLLSFLQNRNIGELNRGILVELIKNIYVYQDGGIEIEFGFADQFRVLHK